MSKSTGISKNVQKDTENIEIERKKVEKDLGELKEKKNSKSSPNKKETTSKKTTSSNSSASNTKATTKPSSAKKVPAKNKTVVAEDDLINEKILSEKNAEKVKKASASKASASRKTATTAKTSATREKATSSKTSAKTTSKTSTTQKTGTTAKASANKTTAVIGKATINENKTINSKKTANKTAENKAEKDNNNINTRSKGHNIQENTKNEIEHNEKNTQGKKVSQTHKKIKDKSKDLNVVDEEEIYENEEEQRETKYDTVTLEQIKEAIGSKVDNKQKKNIIKDIFINLGIAIIMVAGLIIVMLFGNDFNTETLEKSIKITTLAIVAVGIIILEASYKKDSSKMALNGVEILVYGGSFVCLIYTVKLYFQNLTNVISILTTGIAGYYILKSIIVTILNTKKFKRENNDIKEIIKKKKVVNDE